MSSSFTTSDLKVINKRQILKFIFNSKETTRKEIAIFTGLSNSSVTRIINSLIDENFIHTKHKINESRYGRKSEVLSINKDRIKILVVDIDVNTTMFGFGRFDGEVEILKTIPTPDSFERLQDYLNNFINLFKYKFDYISFSIPGIVDVYSKTIVNTPNLKWNNIKYDFLNSEHILVENDSNLSILAEKTFSDDMNSIENAIFLLLKSGIGAGIMINNEIFRGKNFAAGEIGHNYHINGVNFEKVIDLDNNMEKSIDDLALNISYALNLMNFEKIIIGGNIINYPNKIFEDLKNKIIKYSFVKDVSIRVTNFNYVPASMVGACFNAIFKYIDCII
ncbi:ROK family transcriptional regulator [Oceanotoga teriensis]|jgi:predicted NBD/HSP70 family sugar kinase|uniref:ROK family transcriptional regulator n=1 Tax=Oceanotoga teriensis TaxID=515440 RepID=UPI0027130FCB|nr:ROK family transcriptional regulator [Oceanotoga teriensis]MDO7977889.1 ROK family transcriptional regulator [Oceanotoga teriensis]